MDIVYTKTSAAKILNVRVNEIESIIPSPFYAEVKLTGEEEAELIPSFSFIKEFFASRKERSKQVRVRLLKVTSEEIKAWCYSGKKYDHKYLLIADQQQIFCQCEDYHQQQKYIEQPMCKHIYAYLDLFQIYSTKEYFELAKNLKTYDDVVERIAF